MKVKCNCEKKMAAELTTGFQAALELASQREGVEKLGTEKLGRTQESKRWQA